MPATLVEIVGKNPDTGRSHLHRFIVDAATNTAAWQDAARLFTHGGRFAGWSILDGFVSSEPHRLQQARGSWVEFVTVNGCADRSGIA